MACAARWVCCSVWGWAVSGVSWLARLWLSWAGCRRSAVKVHGRSVWGLGLLWTGSCSRLWLLGLWLWVGPRGLCEPCFVALGRGHGRGSACPVGRAVVPVTMPDQANGKANPGSRWLGSSTILTTRKVGNQAPAHPCAVGLGMQCIACVRGESSLASSWE